MDKTRRNNFFGSVLIVGFLAVLAAYVLGAYKRETVAGITLLAGFLMGGVGLIGLLYSVDKRSGKA